MTTQQTDLYGVLGLSPTATQAELSRAYRELLRHHHPDVRTVDPGSPSMASDATLQDVLTAYDVLRDAARRADYDRRRGVTAPPSPRRPIRVRWTPTDSTFAPPIQAGPVYWAPSPGAIGRNGSRRY